MSTASETRDRVANAASNGAGTEDPKALAVRAARADIARMEPAFRMVLPADFPADRLVRVLQTVVQANPELARPDVRPHLLGAAMTCAQLGLDPTPAIGHAYIYPFKKDGVPIPTFVLGYKGAIFLAADHGIHFKSWVICENDHYEVELGTNAHINHKLPPFGTDRGAPLAYYCVATFADGSPPMFEVMTKDEIDRVRNASPSKNSPAWRNHLDEMAKKTVLKRLSKNVPIGQKLSRAVAHDGQVRVEVAEEALDAAPVYNDDDVVDAELVEDGHRVNTGTGEIAPAEDAVVVEDIPPWGEGE